MSTVAPPELAPERTDAHHEAYFADQLDSNREFWARFGRRPDLAGRKVLDLGCGHGAMTIEVAAEAQEAVGVDLHAERVRFARRHLQRHHVALAERVRFELLDIAELDEDGTYDVVLSKDTFEHVSDMAGMLRELHRLLVPGGEIWAGFSPLFHSPKGDHGRTGLRLPWAHVVLPRAVVLRAAARHRGHPVRSLDDLGLNGMTARQFRRHVAEAGLELVDVRYNRSDKRLVRALGRVRRFGPLETPATVGVYAVLRRPR